MIHNRNIRRQVKKNTDKLDGSNVMPGKVFSRVLPRSSPSAGGSGGTHKAFPVADAGTGKTIDCYLDTDLTGTVVEVNCSIFGGSDLNEASPLLEKEADPIFIQSIGGEWWCISPFDIIEECTCEEPA